MLQKLVELNEETHHWINGQKLAQTNQLYFSIFSELRELPHFGKKRLTPFDSF